MKSEITKGSTVTFPEFKGTQLYMQRLDGTLRLPAAYRDYQPTVDQMLRHVDTTGVPVFVTIDERELAAGETHRRPGAHIDGVWNEEMQTHGRQGGHIMEFPDARAGTVLLAASDLGCVGYPGEFATEAGHGGDMEHVRHLLGTGEALVAHKVYVLNQCGVHESVPVTQACKRTLIRVSVGGAV